MRFGLAIPTCREGIAYDVGFATPQALSEMAAAAEDLGYDAVWANQHLITQGAVAAAGSASPRYYDPIVSLAYLAATLRRVRLVLGTVIAPVWTPIPLAKQVATLDQLSGGRVTLGLGIGAYPEEVAAVLGPNGGAPDRARRLEEMVRALRALFRDHPSSFAGSRYSFTSVTVAPKPLQQPLPIYLAANSPAGVARVGALADGWIVASKSPEQITADRRVLQLAAEQAGRRLDDIEICAQLWVSIAKTADAAHEVCRRSRHFRRMMYMTGKSADELMRTFQDRDLLGTPQQVAERLSAYAAAGVHHVALVCLASELAEALHAAQIVAEEVIPDVRARTATASTSQEW